MFSYDLGENKLDDQESLINLDADFNKLVEDYNDNEQLFSQENQNFKRMTTIMESLESAGGTNYSFLSEESDRK